MRPAHWLLAFAGIVLLATLGCANCTQPCEKPVSTVQVPAAMPSFGDLQADIEAAIHERGGDAQRGAYNFAIVFNTASMGDPGPALLKELYRSLLWHYLVGRGAATGPSGADTVSVVPFQIRVRDEARYDLPFAKAVTPISDLLGAIPDKNNQDGGGHDLEGAVWTAWYSTARPRSTVYIVFSDTEYSSLRGPLAREDEKRVGLMQAEGMAEPLRKRSITDMIEWPRGNPHAYSVYLRVYVPLGLTPIGDFGPQTRAAAVARANQLVGGVPGGAAAKCPSAWPCRLRNLVLVLLPLVLMAGAVALLWRRLQPRSTAVSVDYVAETVTRGRPLFVGGKGAGSGSVELASLPEGQRVARIVAATRQTVQVENPGFGVYQLVGPSPLLVETEKKVTVRNQESGEQFTFTVKINR